MLIVFEIRKNFHCSVGNLLSYQFKKWMIRLTIKYRPHIKFDQHFSLKANPTHRRNYGACSM
jgi:hypothetical protein